MFKIQYYSKLNNKYVDLYNKNIYYNTIEKAQEHIEHLINTQQWSNDIFVVTPIK